MRRSMSQVSSTGESLRLRKSFPICSMEAKARSLSVMDDSLHHLSTRGLRPPATGNHSLENFVTVPEISDRPDVGEDERDAKLIFRAHGAEVQPAVLEREPAATSVIADLNDLVLQGLVGEVVPDAPGKVEALAILTPIAD